MQPIFTIGHSNHSLEDFVHLLQQHQITALADVRSAPYSRYLPHFNKKRLQAYLPKVAIHYVFLGQELGARPTDPNCYVEGKAVYAKIAATEAFQQGLKRLVSGAANYRIALMCAEKDPLTCHRAILISQHLLPFNLDIAHIHSDGALELHEKLEERLLKAHHLQEPPVNQLSLLSSTDSVIDMDRGARVRQAYQQQGDKVAYVEHQQPEP
ncbi:MAG: DUF488 family protein [Leptolyngbyaceae cyanobacterium]